MQTVKIVTDSGCDLDSTVAAAHGITIVPLVLNFGKQTYTDDQITREEFWSRMGGPEHPQTSQPSSGAFYSVFKPLVEAGHKVVCLTLTSKHSGTYNSAWAAAQEFGGDVVAFDSQTLSLGLGYMALRAAQAAGEGAEISDIIPLLESIRERLKLFILLDTIENLRRGGRANALMPVLDQVMRALQIKPMLTMVEGELKLFGTPRSFDKGVQRLREAILTRTPAEMLIVVHTRIPEVATSFAHDLAQATGFHEGSILIGEAGPVLATHAGAGVLAAAVVPQE
ncbi:MAG: DegV family protein [Chloroflexi bacterium]|nr:DegV family protein [Chloroflexota bacterium]